MLGGLGLGFMSAAVDCTSEDLSGENALLREEISELKGHLGRLLQDHSPQELLSMVERQLQQASSSSSSSSALSVDGDGGGSALAELQSEVEALREENVALERFNQDQAQVGRVLREDNERLQTQLGAIKLDLLRLLPLQCEKDKLRKMCEESGSQLRQALADNTAMRAELTTARDTLGAVQQKAHDLQQSMLALQDSHLEQAQQCEQLQAEVGKLTGQLASEARKSSDLVSELAAAQQVSRSQKKELERLLQQLDLTKQDALILKSRLSLRDEALREHAAQSGVSELPDPPHLMHVISPKKPRLRKMPPTLALAHQERQGRSEQVQVPVQAQALALPGSPTFEAQCGGLADDFAASLDMSDMPSCMPIFPSFLLSKSSTASSSSASSSSSAWTRKTD